MRGGAPGAGAELPLLTSSQQAAFDDALDAFAELDTVSGAEITIGGLATETSLGLGPRFNADGCAVCHSQPTVGGSSPAHNPQFDIAFRDRQTLPWFVAANGPVREARFVRNPDGTPDGGVHDLFVITGRFDNPTGCNILQPDFLPAGNPVTGQGGNPNIIFRTPTPLFGAGLIENIADSTIVANMNANLAAKQLAGISGTPNRSGNDGTITRFGWKAQNKSLLVFAGEAYNVEQGVTNEGFGNEREDNNTGCVSNPTPEDASKPAATAVLGFSSDVVKFAFFMRFLGPPIPAVATPAITAGRAVFDNIGCALCHTPSMLSAFSTTPSLSNQVVNLFSDLLLHHMGTGLADGVSQGNAGPDQFRTSPLWGLGQRLFFLHDGRTSDLVQAITAHASTNSEANTVVARFNALNATDRANLLAFLRSL